MDVLNLVVDLTRRPANPKAYLDCVEALSKRALELGWRPNPIVLTLESAVSDPWFKQRALSSALRAQGESPLEAARSAAVVVRNAPTLVLSSGVVVSPEWLPRALQRFAEKNGEALVYPELGIL